VLFHSPHRGSFHLSLTVLVHYRSSKVFSLGRWAPQLHTELACSVLLRIPTRSSRVLSTGLSPPSVSLSSAVPLPYFRFLSVLQPRTICMTRFGLLRFRSPLLTESFLLLQVLRCFSSLSSPLTGYVFTCGSAGIPRRGFPHSDIYGSLSYHNSP
jgi:hypothetical protein